MAKVYGKKGQSGVGFAVAMGRNDVAKFRSSWPASGLDRLRSVKFEYDSRGDLVDIHCNKKHGSCERFDGPALNALSQDAQCLGEKRLRIRGGRCER